MKKVLKTVLKSILWVIGIVIAAAALFLGWLTLTEYKPAETETVGLFDSTAEEKLPGDRDISILTWNVGYCALGKDADFIMDGGGNAPAATKEVVQKNIDAVASALSKMNADVTFLQEVDANSNRSYYIDQRPYFSSGSSAFGINFKANFVPYPIPPIGKVESGVFTTSRYFTKEDAARISLPCPFSWPLRIANLKRALLITRIPVEGSNRELVLVNFHLEAYDGGEGKIAQTKKLLEILGEEYSKGNYVIAGGDWNQTFPGSLDVYPNTHPDLWAVGLIDQNMIPDGWTIAYDSTTPTCRLLNQPYDPSDTANTQYYVIDGFIASPNIEVKSVETKDLHFENSDHNPVLMTIGFRKE